METDLHLQISQHQASLKQENFTLSYHSYTTLLPLNISQLQLHFICTLYNINHLRFTKIRVSWNDELPLHQGLTTFCYCRPPMSSSYIYEIRLIGEQVTAKCEPTQNTFKDKLIIYSITPCDITIQIVTHRVDWFSCLGFVLFQYTPARPSNLIFQITCGRT